MFYDDPKKHGLKFNPLKALVAPRPIAWVSSRSVDGVPNLAPYSFFNAVSEFPPMIVFAPNGPRPSGAGAKVTLENIEKNNEIVVNQGGWDLRDQMNRSPGQFVPEGDHFGVTGRHPGIGRPCGRARG